MFTQVVLCVKNDIFLYRVRYKMLNYKIPTRSRIETTYMNFITINNYVVIVIKRFTFIRYQHVKITG